MTSPSEEDERALAKAISELDRSHPRPGWEDGVRARIAARKAEQGAPIQRSAGLRIIGAAMAIAASIAVAVWIGGPWSGGPADPRAARVVIFEKASESRRSGGAGAAVVGEALSTGAELSAGDTVALGVPEHGEVRVYRGDREVVFRSRAKASFTLAAPGAYRVVWIEGSASPPEPAGSLEQDSAAVLAAGGRFELGPQLNVR